MFHAEYPVFQKGRVLKREMLENLRDYPRHFLGTMFMEHADGILSGALLSVQDRHLIIKKGIVKFQGRLYMLENDLEIPYHSAETEQYLKIRFHEKQEEADAIYYATDVIIDHSEAVPTQEIELARFKLKEGAVLRSTYESLADFATEYNTINLIHRPYAGRDKSTFSPTILRYFAREALASAPTNPYDITFAMQCLNSDRTECEVILYYIGTRIGTGYQALRNEQIHQYLCRILKEIQGGSRAELNRGSARPRRMIVD